MDPVICQGLGAERLPYESPNLIGLEFSNFIALQYFGIEKLGVPKCHFQPAVDCAPGHSLDPGDSRFPDSIDRHSGDLVKAGARTLQTVVCGPISRREGPTTVLTAVSSPPTLPGIVEGMTDDYCLVYVSENEGSFRWDRRGF